MTALEGYDGHVWSGGGTGSGHCLKEWALDGGLTKESDTSDIGGRLWHHMSAWHAGSGCWL